MTSMIQRGAEAMRARRRELIAQPLDRIWPDLMRAAIEAMQEPTEEMILRGNQVIPHNPRSPNDSTAPWRAMISAALKEQP